MNTVWMSERLLRSLGQRGHEALAEALRHVQRTPPAVSKTSLDFEVGSARFRTASILPTVVGLFDVSPAAADAQAGRWRDLIISWDVLEELLERHEWDTLFKRLLDISNIDEARDRSGLKYVRRNHVHAVFAAGGYHRFHFTMDGSDLACVLGLESADYWATHADSDRVRQPTEQQLSSVRKLQDAAHEMRKRLEPLDRAPASDGPASTPAPLKDGWTTLNRLRELGIHSEAVMRMVLDSRVEDDLVPLMDHVDGEQFDAIQAAFNQWTVAEARRREQKLSTLEVYELSTLGRAKAEAGTSFETALARLTPGQAAVVKLERGAPIRLQGGPGTGKTFTAILRAGYLVKRAQEQGERVRVGFFVFNEDLGAKVFDQVCELGLAPYLGPTSPQQLCITSLHDWCARFVKVDELGVEPLAPYRAEKGDSNRHAALTLAVDEARRRLSGAEFNALWEQFNAKSKNGLWEIETEISQFIKARDITDLTAYLAERRPKGWWLAGSEKPFKRFVWEIASIYNETLRKLGFVDSDDLTNDAIKEVSKTTWQQYRKPEEGFDYLILDEAQDFFRNQLTLLRHLVKRPEGFMMCFDQAQAVYARHPSLRDIGFDTDARFHGTRLEENFRSTKQIVAALQQLIVRYPTLGLVEDWGAFKTGSEGNVGERPSACGFATEAGMFDQVRDLVRAHLDAGKKASEVGIIGFDEAMVNRAASHLSAAGVTVHRPEGEGRRPPARAVTVSSARQIKGQQFELCVVVGLDRDRLPNFTDVKSELHRETRREDDLRLFLVALSRCKRSLHLLWSGTEPSEFVVAMGDALDRRG